MVCGHVYVTKSKKKTTKKLALYIYNFFRIMLFFQKLVQKVVKIGSLNMKVYYRIRLNDRWTEHPENFKIKL